MGELTGRRAWITGAGIGAALGAEVVLSARRAERLETLAAGIRADGGVAHVLALDGGSVATELPDTIHYGPVRTAVSAPGALYGPDVEILAAEDITDAIAWAVTRPPHVNVGEITIRPRVQET